MNIIRNLYHTLGPLRCILAVVVSVIAAMGPFTDGQVIVHGWRLFTSVVIPSLMMIALFVLLLDITMSRVFMIDAEASHQRRLRHAIYLETSLLVVLIAAWSPFIFKVLDLWPFD